VPAQGESQQKVSTQLPEPHCAPVVQLIPLALSPDWQVPAASQYCGNAQVTVAALSGLPAGRFTQLPALPVTLQAWQVPRQALLQQVPSTQKVLPQSLETEHAPPLGFLFIWHEPLTQYWLVASQVTVALWSC
jgi:hypothetical protein